MPASVVAHELLTCPLCRRLTVEQVRACEGGAVEEPYMDGATGNIKRRVRPATYWACFYCEWADLDRPEVK